MAIKLIAGFDYDSIDTNVWNVSQGGRNANARTGPFSAQATTIGFIRDIGVNMTTFIIGFGIFKTDADFFLLCRDGGSDQLTFLRKSDGAIEVRRGGGGGAILGTSAPGVFPASAWTYIEVKVTVDDSAGAVDVQVNGTNVLSLTGLDNQQTGNNYITRYGLATGLYDDHYLADTSGPAPGNDFLGDVKVETLYPNAAGDSADFTPSAGSNYQNVDEPQTNDGDTTYNESSTTGDIDLFNLDSLVTTSGTVFAVQQHMAARKTDGVVREVRHKLKSGSTTVDGATVGLGTSYQQFHGDIEELDPDTAAAWTISGVNALQIGYENIT